MTRWGNTEFDDLKNLSVRLDEYIRTQALMEDVARELAKRLLGKVIPRTPVDTGTLRKGWTAETQEDAENGNVMSVEEYVATLPIVMYKNYVVIEIVNPVEYAKYRELGHRTRDHKGWVSGSHFLRISVNELQREEPRIVQNILMEQLKEVFK